MNTCPLTAYLQCGMSESVSVAHWQQFDFILQQLRGGATWHSCEAVPVMQYI